MIWFLTVILVILTSEVQSWCFTLGRHAWWSKNHPELDRRCFNYKSLFYISSFSSILSGMVLFAWIYVVIMGCMCSVSSILMSFLFTISFGSKIILIGYTSLLAKLCGLNKYYYPYLTTFICKYFRRVM